MIGKILLFIIFGSYCIFLITKARGAFVKGVFVVKTFEGRPYKFIYKGFWAKFVWMVCFSLTLGLLIKLLIN